MDLTQKKLSKAEWMNIEIMVPEDEKSVLKLIIDGYYNVNLKYNDTQSLLTTMKLDFTPEIEKQLYKQYFEPDIQTMMTEYERIFASNVGSVQVKNKMGQVKMGQAKMGQAKMPQLKKRDLFRIQNMDSKMDEQKGNIYEYIILGFCKEILKSLNLKTNTYAFYLYTLLQLQKSTISKVNSFVIEFVDKVVNVATDLVKMMDVLKQSYDFIEKNPHILKYEDRSLYSHQKELFTIFKHAPKTPKLVLYMAPTGTGKTLSPLGLSEGHRIIFICAARHIGLALAKSAVSMGKRIAFAFGCETAADVRLHYFSISEYIIKRDRHGEIVYKKPDNSVGDKVQIMICDVQSYLIAMHYMMAFSPLQIDHPEYVPINDDNELLGEPNLWPMGCDADLITYWDEPTITMDYNEHPLHEMIHRNWNENRVSKVVLSCATLPKEHEILNTIDDFRLRFSNAQIHTINSFDCKKSISLLNKSGKSVVPHLLFRDFDKLQQCITHCTENKTILRYFDLVEVIKFIELAHSVPDALNVAYMMDTYFSGGIAEITMNSIKLYYLEILQRINPSHWSEIQDTLIQNQQSKFKPSDEMIRRSKSLDTAVTSSTLAGQPLSRSQSVFISPTVIPQNAQNTTPSPHSSSGILLTTLDAHTLTDGPTIFLTEDVEKVGLFYIQQSNISPRIFQSISEKLAHNSVLQQKMDELKKLIEDKLAADENQEQTKGSDTTDKVGGGGKGSNKSKKFDKKGNKDESSKEIAGLQSQFEILNGQIKMVTLDNGYIPNTLQHQHIWSSSKNIVKNAFVPSVDEDSVHDIMALDVTDQMKLLLLMGIGMFINEQTANPRYMEIMKRLAYTQQLFLILASSDYIYGTNYQFCHGFIGKDLQQMTQQKTIQALGRIGRNKMQQEYTVRFRDDAILIQLFVTPQHNQEANVMSRLFYTDE